MSASAQNMSWENRMQLAGIIDSTMDAIVSMRPAHSINTAAEECSAIARRSKSMPFATHPERFGPAARFVITARPEFDARGA
jgi:hypothetical protein